jgi:hypothetical protein
VNFAIIFSEGQKIETVVVLFINCLRNARYKYFFNVNSLKVLFALYFWQTKEKKISLICFDTSIFYDINDNVTKLYCQPKQIIRFYFLNLLLTIESRKINNHYFILDFVSFRNK